MRIALILCVLCLLAACGDEGKAAAPAGDDNSHLPGGPVDPDNPEPDPEPDPEPQPNPEPGPQPEPANPTSAQLESQLRGLLSAQGFTITALTQRHLPAIENDVVAQLGRELFFSKSLSLDNTVACVSCHDPRLAGGGMLYPSRLGLVRLMLSA